MRDMDRRIKAIEARQGRDRFGVAPLTPVEIDAAVARYRAEVDHPGPYAEILDGVATIDPSMTPMRATEIYREMLTLSEPWLARTYAKTSLAEFML